MQSDVFFVAGNLVVNKQMTMCDEEIAFYVGFVLKNLMSLEMLECIWTTVDFVPFELKF